MPATVQPALATFARPYADLDFDKVGISSVMVYGNGARVRVASRMGKSISAIRRAFPKRSSRSMWVPPMSRWIRMRFSPRQRVAVREAAMKAILPEAHHVDVTANNTQEMQQRLGGK